MGEGTTIRDVFVSTSQRSFSPPAASPPPRSSAVHGADVQRQALRAHHFEYGDKRHTERMLSTAAASYVAHPVDLSQWEEIPAGEGR